MYSPKDQNLIDKAAKDIFHRKLKRLGATVSELDDYQRQDLREESQEEAEARFLDHCENQADIAKES